MTTRIVSRECTKCGAEFYGLSDLCNPCLARLEQDKRQRAAATAYRSFQEDFKAWDKKLRAEAAEKRTMEDLGKSLADALANVGVKKRVDLSDVFTYTMFYIGVCIYVYAAAQYLLKT